MRTKIMNLAVAARQCLDKYLRRKKWHTHAARQMSLDRGHVALAVCLPLTQPSVAFTDIDV